MLCWWGYSQHNQPIQLRFIRTRVLPFYMKEKENTKYFTGIRATKLPPPFPAYYGEEKYIFVSYAHKDSEIVFPILDKLHESGIRLWYDEGLQAGDDWFEFMKEKIAASTGFLVFLSEKMVASPHANEENLFAHNLNKKIIAVQIDSVQIPPKLSVIIGNEIISKSSLDILFSKIRKILD